MPQIIVRFSCCVILTLLLLPLPYRSVTLAATRGEAEIGFLTRYYYVGNFWGGRRDSLQVFWKYPLPSDGGFNLRWSAGTYLDSRLLAELSLVLDLGDFYVGSGLGAVGGPQLYPYLQGVIGVESPPLSSGVRFFVEAQQGFVDVFGIRRIFSSLGVGFVVPF